MKKTIFLIIVAIIILAGILSYAYLRATSKTPILLRGSAIPAQVSDNGAI